MTEHKKTFDVAILGAGPGGYVAALRAAQLNSSVALIDRRAALGGTCLNVGCIPSKALLESSEWFHHLAGGAFAAHGIDFDGAPRIDIARMMARKDRIVKELTDGLRFLMKKRGVTVLQGEGKLVARDRLAVRGEDGASTEIQAKSIILAAGSAPVALPFLPFNGTTVVSSTEALSFPAIPRRLAVIGAGAVGLELGSVWRRLGAEVEVFEMLPRIVPWADAQTAKVLERALVRQGMRIHLNVKVTGAEVGAAAEAANAAQVRLTIENAEGAREESTFDRVLVAVGRRPASQGLGLEAAGVAADARGQIPVDARFQTNVPGIYAIGDLIRGPMLAHKAEEEGAAVAEILAGKKAHVNYDAMPNAIYTAPELASAGLTEEEVKSRGINYKTGIFLFRANGRAKTLSEFDGHVKILADAASDRVLGVHMVGPRASDLIAEAVVALEFQASAEDLARTFHAHPTLSETLKEAAMAVDGRAIHG